VKQTYKYVDSHHFSSYIKPSLLIMVQSVFITGATGYIGGSLLHELVQNYKNDYEVTALVRSQASALKVQTAGASAILGSYDQPEVLVEAAKKFDVSRKFITTISY
jgi:uncharacterized protein YbjT (DUF2867 family)